MLQVDLRAARAQPVETSGVIDQHDPLFEGTGFRLGAPVEVRGRLSRSGAGRFYWQGSLSTAVEATCRRCLRPVGIAVAPEVRALFAEDDLADDGAVYRIPPGAASLLLGEAVREELILAVPEYVVCREDCKGLCARCGKDLNEGSCECRDEPDPRWAALEALPAPGADEER